MTQKPRVGSASARAAFIQAVGGQVAHVTAASNLPSIRATGLHPAAALARAAGLAPGDIILRDHRRIVGLATLNHQRPILRGLTAARHMLDGHTAESWAAQLDTRVFFWPARRGAAFAASVARDVEIAVLWLDAGALFDACADRLDLCPINSGNFTQGGARARRGDWIYVPASAGFDTFRQNRLRRGLVRSPDAVREVSVRGALPARLMAQAATQA